MLLFADGSQTQEVAWSAVVMSLTIGALQIGQMIVNHFDKKAKAQSELAADKQKKEFDSQLMELKQKQKECEEASKRAEEAIEKCEKDREEIRAQHRQDVREIKDELSKCHERHEKTDKMLQEVLPLFLKRKDELAEREAREAKESNKRKS